MTLTDERVRNGEYKLQPVATASALYSTLNIELGKVISKYPVLVPISG